MGLGAGRIRFGFAGFLAIGVTKLHHEIVLRADDGQAVEVVVARQGLDVGNVVVAKYGKTGGGGRSSSTKFSYIGEKDEQAVSLLHRAADYLEMRGGDAFSKNLAAEIQDWLSRNAP